jgi:hypothetical protein
MGGSNSIDTHLKRLNVSFLNVLTYNAQFLGSELNNIEKHRFFLSSSESKGGTLYCAPIDPPPPPLHHR